MADTSNKTHGCQIVSVGKRRDGGTRYWCLKHRADATAKYGTPAHQCLRAGVREPTEMERVTIDAHRYPGGLAFWGAVPPVYDTTSRVIDQGIHVHARAAQKLNKVIDKTYRHVDFLYKGDCFPITELDAIYFMVSTVFGFELKSLFCDKCAYPHLDKDWFAVHPHQVHLCAGCGRKFRDSERAVGNPVSAVREATGLMPPACKPSSKSIHIAQDQFPGGLQIWASNPAILWTNEKAPESGIHIHAFKSSSDDVPVIDDTFASVTVDGQKLNENHVRLYMAQCAMPHITDRVKYLRCKCGSELFCQGESAYTPAVTHCCEICGRVVKPDSRLRKVIANPMLQTLELLSLTAVRPVRQHDMQLFIESP